MDITATLTEALALHQAGNLDEAEKIYERVILHAPRNADAHHLLGVIYKSRGQTDRAIGSIGMALSIDPTQAPFYNNLGTCYLTKNELVAAELCFRKAVEFQENYPDAWSNLGLVMCNFQRFDDAEIAVRHVLNFVPDHEYATCNMGDILAGRFKFAEALGWYEKAYSKYPRSASALMGRVRCLNELGRVEEALSFVDRVGELDLLKLAEAMTVKGEMLETLGRMEEACVAFDRGLEVDPGNISLLYARSRAGKIAKGDDFYEHVRRYESASDQLVGRNKARLCYALGKTYEDAGEMPEAAKFYASGANAVLQSVDYHESADTNISKAIQSVCTSEKLQEWRREGLRTDVPIFVFGMPRSGTTLVEQIIGSHPDVFAAGELEEASRVLANFHLRPDLVLQNDKIQGPDTSIGLGARAQLYLDHIRGLAGNSGAKRITDKMPANYILAGLLSSMFPDSKLIHCRRSPIDTCISCYVTYFTEGQLWSYDFGVLGRYYRRYWELMEHWRKAIPGRILEVRYDDVVANTEAEARRLVDWCGMPWDDRCLRFYETKRSVNTASVQQVRQPIYTSSMGRWRKWEPFIQPLIAEIGDLEEAYWNEVREQASQAVPVA